MSLYDAIKKYAKLRGMGLKEVATRSGLSQNAIYNWQKHRPSDPTIIAVAKTLGVSLEELTGEKRDLEPHQMQLDIKAASEDDTTVLSWDGKPIPPAEMEMIRRILEGGK